MRDKIDNWFLTDDGSDFDFSSFMDDMPVLRNWSRPLSGYPNFESFLEQNVNAMVSAYIPVRPGSFANGFVPTRDDVIAGNEGGEIVRKRADRENGIWLMVFIEPDGRADPDSLFVSYVGNKVSVRDVIAAASETPRGKSTSRGAHAGLMALDYMSLMPSHGESEINEALARLAHHAEFSDRNKLIDENLFSIMFGRPARPNGLPYLRLVVNNTKDI